MFGRTADARPHSKFGDLYVPLIQEAVTKLRTTQVQLRDWCLGPELVPGAQGTCHAALVEAWPHGGKVLTWLDPYDPTIPISAGKYMHSPR